MSTTALQVHNGEPPVGTALERRPVGLLRPIAAPDAVITAQNEARELVTKALVDGRDYGKIPGTGDKPTLLKPGAERLSLAFGLIAQFKILEHERDHDRVNTYRKGTAELQSYGLYRVVMECSLVHRETGEVVGSAIASCSTLESKYISRPRDSENTVIKMATKRSHVGATLNALGLSEQFTQDVEDGAGGGAGTSSEGAAASSSSSTSRAAEDSKPPVGEEVNCPKCGGRTWDNRLTKTNPKAPDYKCRDRNCDGVVWPPKDGDAQASSASSSSTSTTAAAEQPQLGSLAWAMQLPLMGKPTSWTHEGISYGRKPLGDVPTPALKQARHFFVSKLQEGPADDRTPAMQDQVQAIALVVDERAKLDPKQERLDLDTDVPQTPTPPAAAAVAADDGLPF